MIRLLSKLCALFTLVLLVSWGVRLMLPPVSLSWADPVLQPKYAYYQEHRSEFDTLFIGSSRIFNHISPAVFDATVSSVKTRSFNLGAMAVYPPKTFGLLEEVLEDPHPGLKNVIVEFDALHRPSTDHIATQKVFVGYDLMRTFQFVPQFFQEKISSTKKLRYSLLSLVCALEDHVFFGCFVDVVRFAYTGEVSAETRPDAVGEQKDGHVPVEKFVSRKFAKKLAEKDFSGAAEKMLAETREAMAYAEDRVIETGALLDYLRELDQLAAAQDVKVWYLLPPQRGDHYAGLLPLFKGMKTKYKIAMHDPDRYPDFYNVAYFSNADHFNEEGAQLFTAELAEVFSEMQEGL